VPPRRRSCAEEGALRWHPRVLQFVRRAGGELFAGALRWHPRPSVDPRLCSAKVVQAWWRRRCVASIGQAGRQHTVWRQCGRPAQGGSLQRAVEEGSTWQLLWYALFSLQRAVEELAAADPGADGREPRFAPGSAPWYLNHGMAQVQACLPIRAWDSSGRVTPAARGHTGLGGMEGRGLRVACWLGHDRVHALGSARRRPWAVRGTRPDVPRRTPALDTPARAASPAAGRQPPWRRSVWPRRCPVRPRPVRAGSTGSPRAGQCRLYYMHALHAMGRMLHALHRHGMVQVQVAWDDSNSLLGIATEGAGKQRQWVRRASGWQARHYVSTAR
jgi:hypothetical protein